MSQQQSNELAVIGSSEWQALQQQAAALVASGFLPQSVNTPQKAVAIMMLGRELGIPPWAALTGVNVIQGKPTVSPQLMLALINRSGQLEDIRIEDDGETSVVVMKRRGRSPHRYSFSMADASAMGLHNKDNWKKQPAIMRQWRAVAGCARAAFADVILGLYTPDEMGADVEADEQGNMTVVEAPPMPVIVTKAPPAPQQPMPPPVAQPTPASASNSPIPDDGAPDPLDWTKDEPGQRSDETLYATVSGISWHDKRDGTGTYYRLHGTDGSGNEIQMVAFDTPALDLLGFDRNPLANYAKGTVDYGYDVRVPYFHDTKDGKTFASLDADEVRLSTQYTDVPT